MVSQGSPLPANTDVRRSVSRRIAGAYLLFAGAWIVTSDLALFGLTRDLPGFAGASLVKGGLFVLVTTVLLYLFSSQQLQAIAESAPFATKADSHRPARLNPAAVFGAMALLAIALVIAMFSYESNQHRNAAREQLRAILELKAGQIELLLEQRQAAARSYSRSRGLRADMARHALHPGEDIGQGIKDRIGELQHDLAFDAVLVLDRAGQLVAESASDTMRQPTPEIVTQAKHAMASATPISHYLHRDAQLPDEPVLLDYITPLRATADGQEMLGVIVLRENAHYRFFRLIQEWPTASPSAEALLVRRDGDAVLFLSDVRHATDAAFRLRRPLSDADFVAAKAVQAAAPLLTDGTDYRGTSVVAASRGIAGTDWFLIAKVDRDEILASVRRSALIWLGSILCMSLLATIGVWWLWRQQLRLVAVNELAESAGRRRAENMLSEVEERYRALFERSRDCVFLTDLEGNFLDANHTALELFGYSRDELPSITLKTLLGAGELQNARTAINKVISGEAPRERREYTLHKKGGDEIIVEVSTSLVFSNGKPGALLAIAHDITERKHAESASHARLGRVQQQMEAIGRISAFEALITDDIGNFAREVTREAARVTSVERASVWLFNANETELRCIDLYEASPGTHTEGAILREEHFGNEFRALKNTRYVNADDPMTDPRTAGYVESYLKPLRITSMLDAVVQVSGKHLGLLCFEHVARSHHWEPDEITFACQLADKLGFAITTRARLQIQSALVDSERRFRTLVEQSVSGFYMIQDDRIAYVNSRFAEIFGYASPEEIIGKKPIDLTAAKDRAKVSENFKRRQSGETKSISYSFTGLRKDGSEIELGAHGAYVINEGRPAIIGLLQDISERKRNEDEIQRYVAQLEQAMRGTIGVISAIGEARDPYTHGHERRVGEIAAAIGTEMGWDANRVEGIRIAGCMHDVGKIAVPAEILSKPGKLTKPEYELVKCHAERGYDILKGFEFPWPVAEIAWQHHERLDGSGYPRGLKGDEILLDARVLAVADTVEAMSSHRPYRPGLGIDQALAEISKGAGTLYDRQAVDACRRLFIDKGYQLPE